ncbi:hypothetical protein CAEBREN_29780 [Caenorhabditis brenneri]|uniref:Uncharacterized protein n=1 Tax=Caenorhabditis brenneri TaxID=135651 RepID=G0M9L7_CAEBE|nr:hypothetical protein CAEBREN_29780 [Caenorhabditis brenneri]
MTGTLDGLEPVAGLAGDQMRYRRHYPLRYAASTAHLEVSGVLSHFCYIFDAPKLPIRSFAVTHRSPRTFSIFLFRF